MLFFTSSLSITYSTSADQGGHRQERRLEMARHGLRGKQAVAERRLTGGVPVRVGDFTAAGAPREKMEKLWFATFLCYIVFCGFPCFSIVFPSFF